MSTKIIIPARAGSKGFPGKNVRLFDHTASIIPTSYKKQVTVSTDDDTVAAMAKSYNYSIHNRSEQSASDTADVKSVVQEIVTPEFCEPRDVIIMLYLTYPERTWKQVESMYTEFVSKQAKSMLCRQPVKTHPCLVMLETPGGTGKQVYPHRHYQRQQYPPCFEISHYICMFRAGEVTKLGKNMYNKNTLYHSIDRVVDVDSELDYKQYIEPLNTIQPNEYKN